MKRFVHEPGRYACAINVLKMIFFGLAATRRSDVCWPIERIVFYVSVCRVNIDEFTRRVRSSVRHARTGTIIFCIITSARGFHECGRLLRRRTNETKTKQLPSFTDTEKLYYFQVDQCSHYLLRGLSYLILATQTYIPCAIRTTLLHDVVERSNIKYRCRLISFCFYVFTVWTVDNRREEIKTHAAFGFYSIVWI